MSLSFPLFSQVFYRWDSLLGGLFVAGLGAAIQTMHLRISVDFSGQRQVGGKNEDLKLEKRCASYNNIQPYIYIYRYIICTHDVFIFFLILFGETANRVWNLFHNS